MPGLSQSWEKKLLDCIFKRTAFFNFPTTLYYSLHTADPTDSETTALSNEVSGNNYARANLNPDTNNTTHANYNSVDEPATAQRITNKLEIAFPQATGGAWASGANLTHWGLWTVVSSGTADQYIASGTLTAAVVVLAGQTLKFQAGTPGAFSFTIS